MSLLMAEMACTTRVDITRILQHDRGEVSPCEGNLSQMGSWGLVPSPHRSISHDFLPLNNTCAVLVISHSSLMMTRKALALGSNVEVTRGRDGGTLREAGRFRGSHTAH